MRAWSSVLREAELSSLLLPWALFPERHTETDATKKAEHLETEVMWHVSCN